MVELRTYIVEDNATIRENLIGTLEELTCVKAAGFAETENEGRTWLTDNSQGWDLAIVDLFLKQGSGLGVLEAVFVMLLAQKVGEPQLLAALLAYRAVYYLGPLLVAAVMYAVMEARARRP